MCSTDDWQMEAVHEQYEVFESLVLPHENILVQDKYRLTLNVLDVMAKHLRLRSEAASNRVISETTEQVVKTVQALFKDEKENPLKFSFVVLVTNRNGYPKGLCKIPIFSVALGDSSVYIDINNKIFNSWNAFMEENRSPSCKFCFPVSGRYNVGGKLRIDFLPSPTATQSLVKTQSMFGSVIGKIVDKFKVAASFLIKIAPLCLSVVTRLAPVAANLVYKLNPQMNVFLALCSLINAFRTKEKPVWDIVVPAYKIIVPLSNTVISAIQTAWVDVKKICSEAYNQLCNLFPDFFASASPSSQNEFVAIAHNVDYEAEQIEIETKKKIFEATNDMSRPDEKKKNFANEYNTQIFSNSITECALQGGPKLLGKTTTDLLTTTKEIAKDKKVTTLSDVKTIFEAVSHAVFEEYRNEIKMYTKCIAAAKSASKGVFDLEMFNKNLGIEGDPKDHFMQMVLKSFIKTSRCQYKINAEIDELKEHSKIVLIPLWKKHSDGDVAGVYRCIGVRGSGKLSTLDLLSVLKQDLSFVPKSTVKPASVDTLMAIHSDEFAAFLQQEVNEENTSEGVLVVDRLQ